MPPLPAANEAPRRTEASASASYRDYAGESASIQIKFPAANAENLTGINLWFQAIGNASNAAEVKRSIKNNTQVSITQTTALDEADASVDAKANFVFEDGALNTFSFSIPAPDASIFGADGKTVDPLNDEAADVIARTLTLLNGADAQNPTGTFAFKYGYRTQYGNRGARPAQKPAIAEPAGAVLPPDEPGV